MRTSQRVVAATLGALVVLMLVVAISITISAPTATVLSGERDSSTYDYANFDGIEVSGQWQVTIERGDTWRVAVEVPVELIDEVETELRGDRLWLDYDGGWSAGGFRDGLALKATITMPALESLDVSGATSVSFSGFDGSALSVDASGGVELRGAASRFDVLTLDLSGAGSVNLADVPVTDANIDVSGAANVTLRMAGGRLTGDLSGAANLEYYGAVSEESVDKSGFVNVRRRN